jgi:hypothetical protein
VTVVAATGAAEVAATACAGTATPLALAAGALAGNSSDGARLAALARRLLHFGWRGLSGAVARFQPLFHMVEPEPAACRQAGNHECQPNPAPTGPCAATALAKAPAIVERLIETAFALARHFGDLHGPRVETRKQTINVHVQHACVRAHHALGKRYVGQRLDVAGFDRHELRRRHLQTGAHVLDGHPLRFPCLRQQRADLARHGFTF